MIESHSAGATELPRRPVNRPTLDLRYSEAAWTHRRLQAQVLHARRQLAATRAEVTAAARDRDTGPTESGFGAPIVSAQDEIAEGWAETAQAVLAALDATDAEVRRILDAAEAEARVLAESASRLRTLPVRGAVRP